MLTYMRNRSKTWVKWIIFGAIIVVFVFWGGSTYWSREANMIAKVDRYIITNQQYAKAYEDVIRGLQERVGSALTPEMIKAMGLKERVLDEMIDDYILSVEAGKAGVTVSDEELQSVIRSYPPFQENGQFSERNYRRILDHERLTPAEFEEKQRKLILKEKFYGMLTENLIVSPEEVMSYYKYQNDTFDLNFLTVDAQSYLKDITVMDQELGLYYDKNKEKYKVPPKVTLTAVLFPAASYADKVVVTPEEVREYYDTHKAEFSTEAEIHGRHILIALPQGADPDVTAQKEATALKVLDEARSGGDFAALARQYSEDPGTKAAGGDLGMMPAGNLPQPMRDAYTKMAKGEVAGPVKTQFGFHILKLESREEAKETSFEDASATVIQSMKASRAKILAGDDADSSFKELYEQGSANLADYARKKGLEVKEVGPFSQGDDIGIAGAAEIHKSAFLYPEGELGTVVDTGDGYMIYMVKSKLGARIPELTEVKDRVIQDLKMEKAHEKAKAFAASLEKDRARLESMPRQTTGAFKRTAYAVPQLEALEGVKDDLDKLKTPKTYAAGNRMYVVWLGSLQQADPSTADPAELKKLGSELLKRKKEMAVEQYRQDARKSHKVTIIDESKVSSRPPSLADLPVNN